MLFTKVLSPFLNDVKIYVFDAKSRKIFTSVITQSDTLGVEVAAAPYEVGQIFLIIYGACS